MRKKMQRDVLRKIAEIRRLQQAAAEMLAQRAQTSLQGEREVFVRQQAELKSTEVDWQDAVSRPVLMLETMPLWGRVVQDQEAQLGNTRESVDRADAHCLQAIETLCLAKLNREMADERARAAGGRYLRSREEAALQDVADRHLQHGNKP